MPLPLYVDWVCDSFECVPSVALLEIDRLPAGFLEDVLEARSFRRAYDVVQRTEKASDLPDSPLVEMVQEIDLEVAERELKGGDDATDD